MNLKKVALLFSAVMMTACLIRPNGHGGVDLVPILPEVVELDTDSHYVHGGYHYFYTDDRWFYATTRDGQRSELARSHWPRETRRHGGHGGHR
jgi:hypothetical protein